MKKTTRKLTNEELLEMLTLVYEDAIGEWTNSSANFKRKQAMLSRLDAMQINKLRELNILVRSF